MRALDAAGADPPADRHAAGATHEQARSKAGLQVPGRLATAGGTASWCTARTKTKILFMGDLMVHKVIMRVCEQGTSEGSASRTYILRYKFRKFDLALERLAEAAWSLVLGDT